MTADALDNFCGSKFWDLNVTWNTDSPDVTRCFQLTVLVWFPCAFLWFFGPLEALRSTRSSARNIPWTSLNVVRLVLATLMAMLSAADTGFEARQLSARNVPHPADYVAPAIRMCTFALAALLGLNHRARGRRTSAALFFFWLLLAVCGLPQLRDDLRTLAAHDGSVFRAASFVATWFAGLLQLVLSFFVDAPPAVTGVPPQENPCPEAASSFPSRLMFAWFDGMIWRGFRRPLELADLWQLRPQDATRDVFPPFDVLLHATRRKPSDSKSGAVGVCRSSPAAGERQAGSTTSAMGEFSVLPALLRCFGPQFVASIALRLVQVCLKFTSPMLLSLLIEFAESDEPAWRGVFYATLMLLVAMGETLVLGAYHRITHLVGMRVRTALVATVYRKSLRLSSAGRKESTAGETVNLMSVDAQRFADICTYLNLVWAAPLEITVALVLLWQHLGVSVLAGLGGVLVLLPLSGLVMRRLERLEESQMKHKDARVKLMTELLAGVRVLKLYAWEPSFQAQVEGVRGKEQRVLRERAVLDACISLFWTCAPIVVTVLMFMTYLLSDPSNSLNAEKAFVSLALVNMIRLPLVLLPHLVITGVQVRVSLSRLNKYMNADELDPANVTHDDTLPLSLSVRDGTFAWAAGDDAVLRGVQLAVRPGELAAVVGPVGAGKSSLLAALLGETHRVSGRVNTRGRVAYVPQQAWIQNATLRDNILFGRRLDERRYERVLDACALRPDLEVLPAGDRTEIGEKGINLSGGQKQRISLARAVYANADVYLLDDPLSAVDSHVGKHLFQEVIGPSGLLRNKTRVLVTHAVTYLPETDQVLVLSGGAVTEAGAYDELVRQGGAFADFLAQHAQDGSAAAESGGGDRGSAEESVQIGDAPTSPKDLQRLVSHTSSTKEDAGEAGEGAAPGERLIEDEHMETGRVSWRVYWLYARSMGAPLAAAIFAANCLYQTFAVASGVWLALWSAAPDAVKEPGFYIAIYAAIGVGYALGGFLSGLAPQLGGWRAAVTLHNRLLRRVLRAPLAFFDTTPAGRVIARFGKDIDVLDNYLPTNVDSTVACSFEILGILAIIIYSTPLFLAAAVPILVGYIIIQQVYVSSSRQLYRLESTTRSPVYSHFGETIAGAATIRAFSRQTEFERESEERLDINQRCYYTGMISDRWMEVRVEAAGNLVTFLAALLAALGRGSVPSGLVGLSVSYSLQVTGTLGWLVQIMSQLEKSIVAVERIDEYANVDQEAPWELPCNRDLSAWPSAGEVVFEDLQLRYRPGLDLVLHGVSFHVQPGAKVGIVGRTGAGKSSLTLALFRLVEAAGGRISIDGVDAASLGLHQLRSRLTIIPQEPVLFSGPLRLNLDPFGRHSDAELWRALELAHLREFVAALPAGLAHAVAEGGDNLSVGQRQLVCLARALLRKTKVLVLDEATAAVDLDTDDLIQRTIRSEFADCTVLTIAHRINTIMDCDRVLVLSQGRVVEYDPPADLLQRPDSVFLGMARDAGLA